MSASISKEQELMTYKEIKVQPVAGNIGAEIHGVDLRTTLSESVIAELRQALLQYLVIFFRDQDITPEQHIAFGQRFGKLHIHPYIPALAGYPEIIELRSNDDGPAEMAYQSNQWHTDLTYTAEPSMASILRATRAADAGGDTMFLNLYRAFETLSPSMQEYLTSLTAIHDITVSMPADFMQQAWAPKQLEALHRKTPPIEHPVVCTHPETGRKLLYVNANFTSHIKQLQRHESDALLQMLYAHLAKPENVVRFNWRTHSIAFWDNRCTQHYAINDYHSLRVMHRVTMCGERPS
jgi:taurine dioxygenase